MKSIKIRPYYKDKWPENNPVVDFPSIDLVPNSIWPCSICGKINNKQCWEVIELYNNIPDNHSYTCSELCAETATLRAL